MFVGFLLMSVVGTGMLSLVRLASVTREKMGEFFIPPLFFTFAVGIIESFRAYRFSRGPSAPWSVATRVESGSEYSPLILSYHSVHWSLYQYTTHQHVSAGACGKGTMSMPEGRYIRPDERESINLSIYGFEMSLAVSGSS